MDNIWDHIAFDVRCYEQIQTFEGYGNASKSGTERGRTLVCVAMEPAEGEEQDFDDWYRKQHLTCSRCAEATGERRDIGG